MKKGEVKKRVGTKGVKIDLPKIDFKSAYLRALAATQILKRRNKDLEEALEEMEVIYNRAPFGYHLMDETGIFIRINETELKWLDELKNNFEGKKKFTDVLTVESRKKFNHAHAELINTGRADSLELELLRNDGISFPVLVNMQAVYDEKRNYKLSRCAVIDISGVVTENKDLRESNCRLKEKNEILAKANESLSFLNREKDRFIDIAIHDLQLPLVSISMLSETLQKENIPSGSAEEKRIFQMIHEATLEMKSLLANYLSANLSETGKMSLFFSELNLSLLVQHITDKYAPIAHKKNIALHYENNKQISLYTDRECCTQIIENLLSNAIKYTGTGKNVTIAISGNKQETKIIIADEGPGISEEERPLLFQRFQKLSARPTGGELSTGLGLSIVKYLTAQLKGNITVESEPGKGSTFIVYLPNHATHK